MTLTEISIGDDRADFMIRPSPLSELIPFLFNTSRLGILLESLRLRTRLELVLLVLVLNCSCNVSVVEVDPLLEPRVDRSGRVEGPVWRSGISKLVWLLLGEVIGLDRFLVRELSPLLVKVDIDAWACCFEQNGVDTAFQVSDGRSATPIAMLRTAPTVDVLNPEKGSEGPSSAMYSCALKSFKSLKSRRFAFAKVQAAKGLSLI